MHAGLVGADALWLLDEVHLSRPLEETLDAIATGHSANGAGVLAARPRLSPFSVVKLSATPGERTADAFALQHEDRKHPVLERRLAASKLGRLEQFDGDPAEALAKHALSVVGCMTTAPIPKKKTRKPVAAVVIPPARRIAVVVNRVDLARRVFERIRKEADEIEPLLLTGRIRPLDRDRLLNNESFSLLFTGARKSEPSKPIVLVATQTIEAGADLDFDALIRQKIAPLDSIRQRAGRLDRIGTRGKATLDPAPQR